MSTWTRFPTLNSTLLDAIKNELGDSYDPSKNYVLGRPDSVSFKKGYKDTGRTVNIGNEILSIVVKD